MSTTATLEITTQEKTRLLIESYLKDDMIFNPLWDNLEPDEIDEITNIIWSYQSKSNSQEMKAVYSTVINLLQEQQLANELANVDAYQDFYSNNFDQDK